jgi:hypothetical protein
MQNKLTFITELDNYDSPVSYYLTGDVTDNDGHSVSVGEFTFKFDKAWNTLMYYTQNFKNVSVTFETTEQ